MDAIDHAAALVRLYRITKIRPGARELARTVTAVGRSPARRRSRRWRRKKPVQPHAVEINRLENEADRAYQDAVQTLFDTETDPILIIKWKELFDMLELITDAARTSRTSSKASSSSTDRRAWTVAVSAPSSLIIVVALVFDYINGFHDAANSIATVVSTRVLSPVQAVVVGGVLQLRRGVLLRHRRSPRPSAPAWSISSVVTYAGDPGRAARRDHLEPDHVVLRPADQLVARAVRRLRRRGRRQGRLRRRSSSPAGPRRSSSSSSRR